MEKDGIILSKKISCFSCLHSFSTKNRLEFQKKLCENKDFYNISMPFKDTRILELNQY